MTEHSVGAAASGHARNGNAWGAVATGFLGTGAVLLTAGFSGVVLHAPFWFAVLIAGAGELALGVAVGFRASRDSMLRFLLVGQAVTLGLVVLWLVLLVFVATRAGEGALVGAVVWAVAAGLLVAGFYSGRAIASRPGEKTSG